MEFFNWAWSCICNPRIQEVEQEQSQSVKAAKRKGGKEGEGREGRKGEGRIGNIQRRKGKGEEIRREERGKVSRFSASLLKPQQGVERLARV